MIDSTFGRALLGFILLTSALSGMAYVALWSIDSFGGGVWWGSLLIVLLALAAEIGIYSTTLHEPIYNWVREPARQVEEERERAWKTEAARLAIDAHVREYHKPFVSQKAG